MAPSKRKSPGPDLANESCQPDGDSFLGCAIPADADLLAEGWQRRFIADARMARDAIDSYGQLGYEVKLEPVKADGLKAQCGGCKVMLQQFNVVYTRKKKAE